MCLGLLLVVLSVEGNIGAGKSTFISLLRTQLGLDNLETVDEPVEKWKNVRGKNMLEAFYKDPCK